jgi:8-oxo-dGTP pyrophosphatase MutT (NUDIX family)
LEEVELIIDKLTEKLKNRIPKPLDAVGKFSVLIPLVQVAGKWEVIYELRARHMKTQPGEVSFPGGKVEKGESFRTAAIRETVEELGVTPGDIDILGELDFLVSYANFTIHCFLGVLKVDDLDSLQINPDEVDHIFTVPVDFLLQTEPLSYELVLKTEDTEDFPYELIPRGREYNFREGKHQVLFYQYGDYIVWGLTARLTKHLTDIIREL